MSLIEIVRRIKGTDKRILALKEEIEIMQNEALKKNIYSVFDFDTVRNSLQQCEQLNDFDKYSFFYEVGKNIERFNKLPIEIGEYINDLMNDPNNITAIHRTYLGPVELIDGVPTNPYLYDISKDGLINNGHIMYGAYQETPSLSLTTTPLRGLGDLVNLFSSYKNNNIVIILQFPKEQVKDNLAFVNPEDSETIYRRDGSLCYIRPEYIIGAIVKGEGQDTFYTREQFLQMNNMSKNNK